MEQFSVVAPKTDGVPRGGGQGGNVFRWLEEDETICTYKPRAWRWLNTKQASNKSMEKVIDKAEAFCFRPYSYTQGAPQSLCCSGTEREHKICALRACPPKYQALLAIVAPNLLPYKLESGENITVYNPQRVLQQFEYDEGPAPINGDMSCSSTLVADNMFVDMGQLQTLMGAERLYYSRWDEVG